MALEKILIFAIMKLKEVKDLRVRSKIRRRHAIDNVVSGQLAAYDLVNPGAESGAIEFENETEQYQLSQRKLKQKADIGTQKKLFDFPLPGGPFRLTSSRNGRHMLLSGLGGQLSVMDRRAMRPLCDFTAGESVVDSTFLHNYTMFATAQRRRVYIYDTLSGSEVHCLKDHEGVTHLDYLQHHFLLVSWSENGILRYLDTSTGEVVARHFSKMGPCHSLRQNRATGVVHVGHGNGTVSLWIPSLPEPAMKILCHRGPVTALATHGETSVVTAGADGEWKLWDIRRADRPLYRYKYVGDPPACLDVSQTGMVVMGGGPRVRIYTADIWHRHVDRSYMTHWVNSQVSSSYFCPFEDLVLLGTSDGIGTMLVPGSGSAHFDTLADNPFETRNQRREKEVRSLLEKIRPDMITLPEMVSKIGSILDPVDAAAIVKPPPRAVKGKKLRKPVRIVKPKEKPELGVVTTEGKYDPLVRFRT